MTPIRGTFSTVMDTTTKDTKSTKGRENHVEIRPLVQSACLFFVYFVASW